MSERQKILILGGDLAGPMTAAYLGRHLPASRFEIIFIDPGTLQHQHWHALSHPDLRRFNKALGIKEADFITACDASFRLGDYYEQWGPAPYYNVFSDYGISIDGVGFHHHLLRHKTETELAKYSQYALPSRMAAAGKFSPPDEKVRPVLSDYDYGYHLNPAAYAALLTQAAARFGVQHIQSSISKLSLSNRKIDSVTLGAGSQISVDLYINATGRALVETAFTPWDSIGCANRYRASTQNPQKDRLSLTSHFLATHTGWSLNCPNQVQDLGLEFFTQPQAQTHSYQAGALTQAWEGNIVNLGFASAVIEPFLGLTLRCVQHDIERLLKLFPANLQKPSASPEQSEYNRLTRAQHHYIRDYIAIHNASCGRALRENIPPTARAKLDMFKARGRLDIADERDTLKENWVPMLLGNGAYPDRYNLMAQDVAPNEFNSAMDAFNAIIDRALKHMSSHESFITRRCAAKGFTYDSE